MHSDACSSEGPGLPCGIHEGDWHSLHIVLDSGWLYQDHTAPRAAAPFCLPCCRCWWQTQAMHSLQSSFAHERHPVVPDGTAAAGRVLGLHPGCAAMCRVGELLGQPSSSGDPYVDHASRCGRLRPLSVTSACTSIKSWCRLTVVHSEGVPRRSIPRRPNLNGCPWVAAHKALRMCVMRSAVGREELRLLLRLLQPVLRRALGAAQIATGR